MKKVKYKYDPQLTRDQNHAVEHFLSSYRNFVESEQSTWCYSLSGYAGTGKTYLISELIKQLSKHNVLVRVAVTAPTNKSVRVLCEKLQSLIPPDILDRMGVNFGTIHSFLKLYPDKKPDGTVEFRVKETNPNKIPIKQYNLVIVDECSMIGTELMNLINSTVRDKTGIVYVGDIAQLPPVERDTISDTFACKYQSSLCQIVRQQSENGIINLSLSIRERYHSGERTRMTHVLDHENDQVQFVPQTQAVEMVVRDVTQSRIDSRILCYTNRAVKQYNQLIHDLIYGPDSEQFVIGERVIVHAPYMLFDTHTEVDIITGTGDMLITSEECTLVSQNPDTVHLHGHAIPIQHMRLKRDMTPESIVDVIVPDNWDSVNQLINHHFSQWRTYKNLAQNEKDPSRRRIYNQEAKQNSSAAWDLKERFLQLRHAYAMTVHKSQGSTFGRVYVDWNDVNWIRDVNMFNQCMYVAITRPASDLFFLV